jgi:NADH dehydrogenase
MDAMAEQPVRRPQADRPARPQVVIVGAGFGGLSAALKLRHIDADVIVIDQRNHHLFQPLLYQVATAGLSPADIAAPIRGILRRQANTRVVLGTVTGIDREGRSVLIGERRIPYDQLVIATGARDAYFGHDDWATVTSPLKTIEEATTMRRRILIAFEHAEDTDDANERRQLLTFVIVGGGPTGVELAGALAELAKTALVRDFRHIDPKTARIILIEAGPRVLATFPPRLSDFAAQALRRLGVEVRVGAAVTACDNPTRISNRPLAHRSHLGGRGAGCLAIPFCLSLRSGWPPPRLMPSGSRPTQAGRFFVRNWWAIAACIAIPTAIASSLRIMRLE